MPEGESHTLTVESRRTRFGLGELRYELHLNNIDYFPQEELFSDAARVYGKLEEDDFKGLREDACKFSLLKVVDWFNEELNNRNNDLATKVVGKGEIVKSLLAIDSGSETEGVVILESDIDADFFLELSEYSGANEGIMKIKNWDEMHTKRFLSKVASNIFKSGLLSLKDRKVSLDLMAWYFARVQDRVLEILESRKGVALEYILESLSVDMSERFTLEKVVDDSVQTTEDKHQISEVKKKRKEEQVETTLKTVLSNTQFIRDELIPELLNENADSKTAFWKIHAGEFRGDPVAAQMLVNDEIASMFNYVESSGRQFYEQSIGKLRKNGVTSGGYRHVSPEYLPVLQEEFFKKIDTFKSGIDEDAFIDIETVADIAMISLHLPFDGAGRVKEDFFVYLSKKFGFPLTFSVLGFRDIGSPILIYRNEAISDVKCEMNAFILKRFEIEYSPTTDRQSLKLIEEKFNCGSDMAESIFQSEKALMTSQVIDSIGDREKTAKLSEYLPSFSRLKKQWKRARSLKFLRVPEEYQDQVTKLASEISVLKNLRTLESQLAEKVKMVRNQFKDSKIEVEYFHKLSPFMDALSEQNFLSDESSKKLLDLYSLFEKDDFDRSLKETIVGLVVTIKEALLIRNEFRGIFEKLDHLKSLNIGDVASVARLLEVRALGKVPSENGRDVMKLISQVFPDLGNLPPDI